MHWRSIAVQARPKPEYHLGAETKLRAAVGIRVHCYTVSVLMAQFAKTVTNNLPLLSVLAFRANFISFGANYVSSLNTQLLGRTSLIFI